MNKKALWILCILQFILLILLAAFVLGVFYRNGLLSFEAEEETEEERHTLYSTFGKVSMVELLATPEKYHGKEVRVIGVGNIEFEGNCIALSEERLKCSDSCIWVDLDDDVISKEEAAQWNGKYVEVRGTFDMYDGGHYGMFSGSIQDITHYGPASYYHQYISLGEFEGHGYFYRIKDYDGQILVREENLTQMPMVDYVSTHVMGVSFQEAGPSTRTATYYELTEGRVSEPFSYVLTAKYDLVVYAEQRDGQHLIVVRDIFDKDDYYKEYILENVSENVADFVTGGEFQAKGKLKITYLTGADKTETELAITLPPRGYAG